MADNHIPGPRVLMLDLQGQNLSMEERRLLSRQAVGGVILFSRNFPNRASCGIWIGEIRGMQAGDSAGGDQGADEFNASGQVFSAAGTLQVF